MNINELLHVAEEFFKLMNPNFCEDYDEAKLPLFEIK